MPAASSTKRRRTRELGVEMTTGGTGAAIVLPAALDLSAAEGFLATMLQSAESDDPIRLDASAVETLTLPCAQIILADRRSDCRLTDVNPTPAIVHATADHRHPWALR